MDRLPAGIKAHLTAQCVIPKRVLWIAGTYFPDIGGAEWSLLGNACLMKRNFGQLILVHKEHGNRVVDGIPVLECDLNSYDEKLRFISEFNPCFVATQGLYAKSVIEQCMNLKIPVVYFLRAKTRLDFSKYLTDERFKVVANSKWMVEWFQQKWGVFPCLLDPVILPWLVAKEGPKKPEYITHVGDAYVKGGGRVVEIARELSEEKFLVTRSWPALRLKDTGQWRKDRIRQLQNGDGANNNFEPVLVNFDGIPNIRVEWPFLDPSALYRQTKILLVASKWKEPYGRVVIEGLLNNLPIIVGPEVQHYAWSDLVYHINNPDNPKEWALVINKILMRGIENYRRDAIDEFCSGFSNYDALKILEREIFCL